MTTTFNNLFSRTLRLLGFSTFFYTKKATVMSDILEELKYRVLYFFITIGSLVGLVYLNLGLHVEFLWSYYLDYYQFIDFCWYEDIKELNHSSLYATQQTKPFSPQACYDLPIPQNTVVSSHKSYKHLSCCNNLFLVTTTTPKFGQNILVEVDEFRQLFISILSCFSGQLRWTFDLSCGNSIYSKVQEKAYFFNICFIFLFYQIILLLVYHIFCFTTPGIFQQSRLKLLKYLQICFSGLLLHFSMLPYVVSIAEEFAHESVDSELFFSTNFNFFSSWIYCFYLLIAVLFIVYVKIVSPPFFLL